MLLQIYTKYAFTIFDCSFDIQRATKMKASYQIRNLFTDQGIVPSKKKKIIIIPVFCYGKIRLTLSRDYITRIFL